MITVTSLTHPTMIAKIRQALYYAHKGQGHKMNGHGNRCYIQNAQGRNIMRLSWIGGKAGYIVYGSESRDITTIVRHALHKDLARAANTVVSFECQDSYKVEHKRLYPDLAKLATLAGMGAVLTGCSNHGAVMSAITVLGSIFT